MWGNVDKGSEEEKQNVLNLIVFVNIGIVL
jgi:hypothetical protein